MYKIIRYFSNGKRKKIKTVSTLEIAKLHCNDSGTQGVTSKGVKWFDGFVKIGG
jgi:hypothetical protein